MLCRHCGAEMRPRTLTRRFSLFATCARSTPGAPLVFEVRSTPLVCDAHVDTYFVSPDQSREFGCQAWLLLARQTPSGDALFVFFNALRLHMTDRAAMFGVSTETVQRWMNGGEPIPGAVWDRVVTLVLALVAREPRPYKGQIAVRIVER